MRKGRNTERKRVLCMMLGAALTLGLAGCSGNGGTSGSGTDTQAQSRQAAEASGAGDSQATAEGKVTISYWCMNRHDQEYMTEKISEFNEASDTIYIDYQIYTDNFSQMLDLAFSTDTAPDMFYIPDFPACYEKGYMLDLSPYMSEEYKARFGEGAFVEGINAYGDAIYSLPYTASACRLFYNQDIFDRVGIDGPPATVAELVEDAKLVTETLGNEGIYGFSGNFKTPSNSVTRTIDPITQISGGVRSGYDFKEGVYDFSSYKEVLEAFREIFAGGYGFPGSEALDIDPLRTQFAAGNIAMYISVSHAEPGVYISQFPTDINWNCAQLPTLSGQIEGKQNLWFGGSAIGINAGTEHPEEAWEVMEYLHSDEVLMDYYTLGLGTVMIPTVIEKAEPPEIVSQMPDLAINENDQNWPALPMNVAVEGKDYSDVFVECIFGMTDIDTAIEDLNTRYGAAYEKAIASGTERVIYPNFDPISLDVSR